MRLTDVSVRALKPPEDGQRTYFDDTLSGFGVRISQGGTKTFIVIAGPNRRRHTIGRFPILGLSEARTEAKKLLAEITLGKNKPKGISFEDAKEKFLATCRKHNRPRTVRDYERLLKRFPFGRAQLANIARRDIAERLEKLAKTPSEANHAAVAIKIFFRWADRQGYLVANPCSALKVQQATSARERALSDREVSEVIRVALEEPYPFGPIVALLVLTGQRRGEIAALRWDWIDREERIIRLPPEITKNRRSHSIPYGPLTAAVIASIPQIGEHLFPATRSHVRGKPTTVFNGWPKAKGAFDKKLTSIAPYTLHDLRRTFSSQLAALGTPIHVTEKLLNHVSGTLSGVAAVYNRYSYADEMRAAMLRYEEHLRRLAGLNDGSPI